MLRDNRRIEKPILECLALGPRTAAVIADDTEIDVNSVKNVLTRLVSSGKVSKQPAPQFREHKRGRPPFLYSAAG